MSVQLDLGQIIFTEPGTGEKKTLGDMFNDTHRLLLKGKTEGSDGSNAYLVQQFKALSASLASVTQTLGQIATTLAAGGTGQLSQADKDVIAGFSNAVSELTTHLR